MAENSIVCRLKCKWQCWLLRTLFLLKLPELNLNTNENIKYILYDCMIIDILHPLNLEKSTSCVLYVLLYDYRYFTPSKSWKIDIYCSICIIVLL